MALSHALPPLNWLRAFECAARHLSFTAAAGELSLTQSAVSQHVRSLELHLGTTLFIRKARGLALTDSGRGLLPAISSALGDIATATAMFTPQRPSDSLKISCNWCLSLTWLSPRLDTFLAENPGTKIQIVSTLWPDDNKQTDVDIEIRYGAKELVGENAELLLADELVPVCAPEKLPALNDIASIYRAGLIQTVGTSDSWQTWAESLGIAPPDAVAHRVDSFSLALEMARNGLGTALVSHLVAQRDLQKGDLVPACDAVSAAIDNHYLAINPTANNSELVTRFADWLRREIVTTR